ncbi:MAG: maleylpyruvate isomerase N-terminal domain-containing protein [Anaerolineales bacterium]
MGTSSQVALFDEAFFGFCDCLRSLPDPFFLQPMPGWSPRDVAAHLVGWNYRMIHACQAILRGQAPVYYADAASDYASLNAASVAQFASRSKSEMLEQLAASRQGFRDYLGTLDPGEWNADHRVVHHRGGPATVGRIVEALTRDYRQHTREIDEWLARKDG